MNFFKAFRVMGILSAWMEKALVDNIIDENELIELVRSLMNVLGVKAEIKVDFSKM